MKDPQQDFDEEIQFHIEERVREYIARGMTPEAARVAATERLGDLNRVRQACTSELAAGRAAERRRTMMKVSWLDVKLGVRMFGKSPGLSLVSVIGMAVAIAVAVGYFAALGALLDTRLPFDDQGRVVVIRTRSLAGQRGLGAGASMHDFERWRTQLTSVEDLGAFREDSRNLIIGDGGAVEGRMGRQTHLVTVATMTASGFPFTGVSPALGRTLLPEDEQPNAAPVVVIGYDEWQRRFGGDPGALGRVVRLDQTPHTIVGVMPPGFGFPINDAYWVPLRPVDFDRTAAAGTSVNVFGRIVDGFSLQDARAEAAAVSEQMAAAFQETHRDVRIQVQPYTQLFTGTDGPEAELAIRALRFGVSLLLFIVAVNVAILVYARTATRTGEIAVRAALGASRARVVWQLFVEALVPTVLSAAAGLGLVTLAFRLLRAYMRNSNDRTFYWITPESFSISTGALLYSAGLAIVAAAIIGVVPGLKATGRRLQAGLQQFSARGSGIQLGRTWTALIVLQVAVAVAGLPAALHHAETGYRVGMGRPAPAAEPLLRASLDMSRSTMTASDAYSPQEIADFMARMDAFLQRLADEPGVAAVTHADRFPGEEGAARFEIDTGAAQGPTATQTQPTMVRARVSRVAPNFFDVLRVPVLAGRGFTSGDAHPESGAVIVDETFARQLGGGANVLGRRIRFAPASTEGTSEPAPWSEIIGIVPAFADGLTPTVQIGELAPRIYRAARPGDALPAAVLIQVSEGDPTRFADRVRTIAASVHPTLKLEEVVGAVRNFDQNRQAYWYLALGVVVVTASVLLLAAAGIYAMMSFTVAKRRREIGIRAALGADARRVLLGIFGRASGQIGSGVLLGLIVALALEQLVPGGFTGGRPHVFLPIVAGIMFTVGILAAFGPARRGLSVQPTEALREE